LQSRATSNHSDQPKTSVVGHLIRTFISAAASVAGVAAGDFIRDSLKERKTKHTT